MNTSEFGARVRSSAIGRTSRRSRRSSPSRTNSWTRAYKYVRCDCRATTPHLTSSRSARLPQKLDRRLSSPNIRAARFQRFENEPASVESYRRGPGSYNSSGNLRSPSSSLTVTVTKDEDRTMERQTRNAHDKPHSTFGCVKHRDLVRFMVAAGHASDSCLESSQSEHHTSSPSPDYLARIRSSSKQADSTDADSLASASEIAELSREELWRAMMHGPRTALSSGKRTRARDRAASPQMSRQSLDPATMQQEDSDSARE